MGRAGGAYPEGAGYLPIIGEALLVAADGQSLPEQWARRLAEALDLEPAALPEPGGLNEVAIAYFRTGGRRNRLYARLKELLDQAPPAVPAPLAQLAAIRDFKLYVSTTCDSLLAAALNQARFGGVARTQSLAFSLHDKVDDLPGEVETLTAPLVYQLFGRQSAAGDYAVSDEDKLEFLHRLQTIAFQPSRLFDELRRHHLLFIGCHFPDWLARFFIRTVTNQRLLAAGYVGIRGRHRSRQQRPAVAVSTGRADRDLPAGRSRGLSRRTVSALAGSPADCGNGTPGLQPRGDAARCAVPQLHP